MDLPVIDKCLCFQPCFGSDSAMFIFDSHQVSLQMWAEFVVYSREVRFDLRPAALASGLFKLVQQCDEPLFVSDVEIIVFAR